MSRSTTADLGRVDQPIAFYERALEFDPGLVKALDEAIELKKTIPAQAGLAGGSSDACPPRG